MAQRVEDTFISEPPRSLVLEQGFRFQHGETLAPFTIVYETFGELNADRSNAVLVCHALSPGAHAAGKYSAEDPRPGWWDGLVGYGKGIDLAKYFVLCVNFPGSPWGTTAPASADSSGKSYGSRYPWITVEDMVESQRLVADHLGIPRFCSIAGGSLGGMQVLMWAARHPERAGSLISMAAAAAVPVTGVAWHLIGRKLIQSDPAFRGGDYYDEASSSLRGLELARMVGHMTYLSAAALERKFGRRRRGGTRQFDVDSYLEYQGRKFAGSYDANSYIRVQAAMDEMDLDEQFGCLENAFGRFKGKVLLVSFDTDWLFPSDEVARLQDGMLRAGVDATHLRIATPNGHDAFLIDYPLITPPVRRFLDCL